MKTTFDIINLIYGIINVDNVNNLLTGVINRNKSTETEGTVKEIVINSLVNLNDVEGFVQDGIYNINIFAPPLPNNTVDEINLDAITKAVITEIKAYNSGTHYYIFEIESQNLISNKRDLHYVNIRLNTFVES